MVDKLSQSLDEILQSRRKPTAAGRGRGRARRGGTTAEKPATAPTAGVRKSTRAETKSQKAIPTGPSGRNVEGKIVVSNLPFDVNEKQIKDYFNESAGLTKKILLSYGPNGQSRGIATITFAQAASATKAAKELDGLKVDKRPMQIELVVGAKDVPAPPAAKTLSERVAKPKPANKDKAKPATSDNTGNEAKGEGKKRGAGRGRAGRGGRTGGRAKPKTAEELDAEMADYWGGDAAPSNGAGDAPVTNGGAVQPAGGDTGMEDDIIN